MSAILWIVGKISLVFFLVSASVEAGSLCAVWFLGLVSYETMVVCALLAICAEIGFIGRRIAKAIEAHGDWVTSAIRDWRRE